MVQMFNVGPSRKTAMAQGILGSLNKGLQEFSTNYNANKSLEKAMSNPKYEKGQPSERADMIMRALQPYGETGAKILQNKMQIEQMKQQEQMQNVFAKLASGDNLTQKERSILPPQLQIEYEKAKNKPVAGGVSAQPVPPEIAQKIPQILNANKGANADDLAVAFDEQGIPRTFSNSYIENRRRQDEAAQKIPNKKTELAVERDNDLLKEANKFRSTLPTEEVALNAMEDAITTGDQSFFSWDNLAEQTGLEWARTAKGGQFKTGAKTFLINNVTKFGARPNQYIEQQIADSLAKVGRGREANLASLALTRFDTDVKRQYLRILDQLEEEQSYSPGKLGLEAEKRMKDYVEQRQDELSNTLFELSSGGLKPNEVFVYDKDGLIAGTVDKNEVDQLPEGYYVK